MIYTCPLSHGELHTFSMSSSDDRPRFIRCLPEQDGENRYGYLAIHALTPRSLVGCCPRPDTTRVAWWGIVRLIRYQPLPSTLPDPCPNRHSARGAIVVGARVLPFVALRLIRHLRACGRSWGLSVRDCDSPPGNVRPCWSTFMGLGRREVPLIPCVRCLWWAPADPARGGPALDGPAATACLLRILREASRDMDPDDTLARFLRSRCGLSLLDSRGWLVTP